MNSTKAEIAVKVTELTFSLRAMRSCCSVLIRPSNSLRISSVMRLPRPLPIDAW
ncbi:hypothetical protein D3C76_1268050 [compost metagenome]